jgi:hypothetical protein
VDDASVVRPQTRSLKKNESRRWEETISAFLHLAPGKNEEHPRKSTKILNKEIVKEIRIKRK